MPESIAAKRRRVLSNVFSTAGPYRQLMQYFEGPAPAAPAENPPWMQSRSMGLRGYWDTEPKASVLRGLGMRVVPSRSKVQQFMYEGATDEEIQSRFPQFHPYEMELMRQNVIEGLRQQQRAMSSRRR